jgi:proline iminopeptidase
MKSSEGFAFLHSGLHLYYRVLGSEVEGGETLVVPNANWLAELLVPLAERRRLILYDPRGRGRSSAVTDGKKLSLEADVGDLEAVRRYFSLDRMALLGASYHAAVTALYALEHPEKVERLLLVSPITPRCPGEWAQELPTPESLIAPPGIVRLEELRREGVDRSDPVAFCRAWFNYFLLPAMMGEISAASRFPLDDVCGFPNEWPQTTMPLYFRHILPKMGRWDFRPRLAALTTPLLVVQGTDDVVPVEASRDWAAHAVEARFLAVDGAGHHPYIERPKAFFPAAESFLDGHWPAAAEVVQRAA